MPPGAPNLFVTLNPLHEPAEDKVCCRIKLAHPVFRYEREVCRGLWIDGWDGVSLV